MNLRPAVRATRREIISYVFIFLAFVAIGIGFLGLQDAVNRIDAEAKARSVGQCAVLVQVKDAILSVTKPVSEAGVPDAATLARIRAANAARLEARQILTHKLACQKR